MSSADEVRRMQRDSDALRDALGDAARVNDGPDRRRAVEEIKRLSGAISRRAFRLERRLRNSERGGM